MKFSIATASALAVLFAVSTTMAETSYAPKGNQCIKHTDNGGILGCPAFQLPKDKKCKVVPGKSGAAYPDCCPRPVCDEHKKEPESPKQCIKIDKNGGILGCPAFQLPKDKKCKVVPGKTDAAYPDCCPRPVCDEHKKEPETPKQCIKIDKNGGAVGCPAFQLPKDKKCKVVPGKSDAAYPDCCPRPVCDEHKKEPETPKKY